MIWINPIVDGYDPPRRNINCLYPLEHESFSKAIAFCSEHKEKCTGVHSENCNHTMIYTCSFTKPMLNSTSDGCTYLRMGNDNITRSYIIISRENIYYYRVFWNILESFYISDKYFL